MEKKLLTRSINRFFFVFILLGGMIKAQAFTQRDFDNAPSVGDFSEKFPRDIVEIDTFLEHLILGQILEPLITADRLGNIRAGIATSWFFSQDGKALKLKINTQKKFSNGQKITVKDIVFSLMRHLKSKTSQSHRFLNSIISIEAIDQDWIQINLSEKRVAIIKVLSREHLGIVPNGWKFHKTSHRPYIGTGPYVLQKKGNHWYLVKNQYNEDFSPTMVVIWRVNQGKNNSLPDYLPFVTQKGLQRYKLSTKKSKLVSEQLSFVQSSYWWYPGGAHYENEDKRKLSLSLISELVKNNLAKNGYQAATGVIPVGISGHIKNRPKFHILDISEVKKLSENIKEINIACPSNLYKEHFLTGEKEKLEKKYGLKVLIHQMSLLERGRSIRLLKPDIILIRWAGGFNDPEGFLPILDKELGLPLGQFHKPLKDIYAKAKKEESWQERGKMFEQLGQSLLLSGKMVPAWKTPIYRYLSGYLKIEETMFRYSPRFSDIKVSKK